MNYALKSMSLSEILDHSATLMKNHFKMLMMISAYMMIPLQLVMQFSTVYLMPKITPGARMTEAQAIDFLMHLIPVIIVQFGCLALLLTLVLPITEAAVVYAISSEYLGKPTTPAESLRFAFKRFGNIFTTELLKFLIVGLGFILLIIPGIYFLYKYYFTAQAIVVEEKSGTDALKRSGDLMAGNYGTAFMLGLVLFVIFVVVGAVSGFVPTPAARALVSVLVNAVTFTFGIAATVVFYFSCRCKLENFDLTILADSVNAEAPAIAGDAAIPQ